jgi:hypothetical protein
VGTSEGKEEEGVKMAGRPEDWKAKGSCLEEN